MRVLLSIKPEYAEKILDGRKRFEFRKAAFKRGDRGTVVIYATMPVGRVVGEFQIGGILEGAPADLWARTRHSAGITAAAFERYFAGRATGVAIRVFAPRRYPQPLGLRAVSGSDVAPQSFRYLD